MTTTLTEIATEAELFVHDFLGAFTNEQDSLYMSNAHLLVIRNDDNGVTVEPVSSHPDVYELIDEAIAETPFSVRSSDILAVVTSGWAAPLNNGKVEGAPSQHPQRRRVRLMACVRRSDLTMTSVLRFGDTDDVVIDEGEATGTLAEAMLSLGEAGK
jgi:hypothetical protein